MNISRGLWNIVAIGLAAAVFNVWMKLVTARYYVPGVSEFFAMT